jgi:hypothetical protein
VIPRPGSISPSAVTYVPGWRAGPVPRSGMFTAQDVLLDVAVADARGLLVNLITGSTLTGASQAAYREGLVAIGAKDACVPAPAVTPWSSAPPAPT